MFSFLFKKRSDFPPFWQAYLAHFDQKMPMETPVEELRFVVLDTETTGLDTKNDKILSIAAVGVKNRSVRMDDSFECLVHQEKNPSEGVKIHGILTKEMQAGLEPSEAIPQLLEFCRNDIIIGQHIGFDLAMINAVLIELNTGKLKNKSFDTAKLAIQVEHPFDPYYQVTKPQEYSLDALCERYKIPTQERHTAAGDVYITAILFLKLLARLQQRGVKTLGDLWVMNRRN